MGPENKYEFSITWRADGNKKSPQAVRPFPGDTPLGDMPEGTLRTILKQAGIEPETFLGK